MATGDVPARRASDLLTTGVPNLDRLLGGSRQRGSLVLVLGPPGTGKTILAQQLAFPLARQGRSVLYYTGYSEPHQTLLAHNRSLRDVDPALLGSRLQVLSLPDLLVQGAERRSRRWWPRRGGSGSGCCPLGQCRWHRSCLAQQPIDLWSEEWPPATYRGAAGEQHRGNRMVPPGRR